MSEYQNLIQEYLKEDSTLESKQRVVLKAIYQNQHFYNMIKRQEDKINRLVSGFKFREFNRKDIIYRHKQPVKEIFWILQGQMSCWDKKTDQDINTEMKLTGMYEQFLQSNNTNILSRDQQEKFQNIQARLKYLRDPELDQMIRDIDTQKEYFLLNNICNIKRVRSLEVGEIAGENCANSGLKYDGLCIVNSEKCYALSLSTEDYNHIFNTNKGCFYFIKEALQQIFGFSNQKLINRLAYQFEVINYQYNQVIYNEGDVADCVYVIKSGEVEIVKTLSLAQLQQPDILSSSNQNQNQIQSKDKNVEISTPYQVQGSTNHAVLKHVQNEEISKYKRKLKPKVMETQIVLKNQGLLGLEDYVEEANQMQPEKDIEEAIKSKRKSGDQQEKKKKLRYVKAISKSNDTVLLKIRDKYVNNLLNEQGINRHKVTEKMKILKLQYHSERLQKIHEIKSQNNQQNNNGQQGVITDMMVYSNYYDNMNLNNNNTTNNNPPNKFVSNFSNIFNYSQESDQNQKNTQQLRKLDSTQSQNLISSFVNKSNIHFGIIPDRRSSDDENFHSNKTAPSNDKEDILSANQDKIYSFTPQSNKIAKQREGLKNLQQLDIKGSTQNKYFMECNSAEPILTSYSRNSMKKFTDYSSVSITTTASLSSMQKLSPTLSIPVNSYQKLQFDKQINSSSIPCNGITNQSDSVTQFQQRTKVQRQRPSKTYTDINSNSMQSQIEENTSPMPCLHPLIACEKVNNKILIESNKKTNSIDFIKDTNLFFSTSTTSKNQNQQLIQQTDLTNCSSKSKNKNIHQNNEELNLLFLLPEKTKIINQKRQIRQKSESQPNGNKIQNSLNLKKTNSNVSSHKNIDSKINDKNYQNNNKITSLVDLDNYSSQQKMSIQEYLPDTVSTNPVQDEQKKFINRLKGIHPILKKCKTLIFTNEKHFQPKDQQSEQDSYETCKKVQQQQDSAINDQSTQCLSSDRTNQKMTQQKFKNHKRIQVNEKQQINNQDNINCVPLFKSQQEQQNKKQDISKDNQFSHSAMNLSTHKSDNQKTVQGERNDNQTPISIISYKQHKELYADSGYSSSKKKNPIQELKNSNTLEMLRRSNNKLSKNNILSICSQDSHLKSSHVLSNSLNNIINQKYANQQIQYKNSIITQE